MGLFIDNVYKLLEAKSQEMHEWIEILDSEMARFCACVAISGLREFEGV